MIAEFETFQHETCLYWKCCDMWNCLVIIRVLVLFFIEEASSCVML